MREAKLQQEIETLRKELIEANKRADKIIEWFGEAQKEPCQTGTTQIFSLDEMSLCFDQSRLTHPLAGFKYDTFADFLLALNNREFNSKYIINR